MHNDYLDVQVVLRGTEGFGWSERADLKQPKETFNAEKDIQFFDDEPQTYYYLRPGQFTICCPRTAMPRWWARVRSARLS